MARVQKRVTSKGATVYVAKWRAANGTDRTKGGFATKKAANDYAKANNTRTVQVVQGGVTVQNDSYQLDNWGRTLATPTS